MDERIREQVRFVLKDDNELMQAALRPGSDLDARNKQLNRELNKRHEKILVDESGGFDWGAFGSVDFDRYCGGYDKVRYKADKLMGDRPFSTSH